MDDDSEVSKSVHILSGNDDVQSIDANHLILIVTRSSLVLYRLGVGRGIEEFCFCDNKIYLIPSPIFLLSPSLAVNQKFSIVPFYSLVATTDSTSVPP